MKRAVLVELNRVGGWVNNSHVVEQGLRGLVESGKLQQVIELGQDNSSAYFLALIDDGQDSVRAAEIIRNVRTLEGVNPYSRAYTVFGILEPPSEK